MKNPPTQQPENQTLTQPDNGSPARQQSEKTSNPVRHREYCIILSILNMHSDDLIISKADGRPMYLQINGQIKTACRVGDWGRGAESLHPPARGGVAVSVITVKRA